MLSFPELGVFFRSWYGAQSDKSTLPIWSLVGEVGMDQFLFRKWGDVGFRRVVCRCILSPRLVTQVPAGHTHTHTHWLLMPATGGRRRHPVFCAVQQQLATGGRRRWWWWRCSSSRPWTVQCGPVTASCPNIGIGSCWPRHCDRPARRRRPFTAPCGPVPGYMSRKNRKLRTDKFDTCNKRKFWLM